MTLTQFEQSGVILETNDGFRLAIDIGRYTPIEKLSGVRVDAIVVTHIHGDHFSIDHIRELAPKKLYLNRECIDLLGKEKVAGEVIEVHAGDVLDIGGMEVKLFNVDHGPNVTTKLADNFGMLIVGDGMKIFYAGEMYSPSGMDVTPIEVDIILVPVGGHYTFGPKEAVDYVRRFKRVGKVMPMHYYKTPEMKGEVEELSGISG